MSKTKSKLDELTPAQQHMMLQMAVDLGVITLKEVEQEKPQTIIDRYALQKLFWNTKFREPKQKRKMPRVTIRCERAKKVWHAVVKGAGNQKVHVVETMLLTNVTFVNKAGLETEDKEKYVGCGVYHTESIDVYSGFAEGEVVPMKKQNVSVPQGARKLRYDRERGVFYDACTGRWVDAAAYLILLKDCHHAYVPMPKPQKGD